MRADEPGELPAGDELRGDCAGSLHLRSLITLALALSALAGCQRDVGISRIADVGFVFADTGVDASLDVGGGDAGLGGCSVVALGVCLPGRTCCATPSERCVPSASGAGTCVVSGSVAEGGECGRSGVDDCGFGLLCASATQGRPRLVCRRICADRVLDCAGAACSVEVEVGGESIRLCE